MQIIKEAIIGNTDDKQKWGFQISSNRKHTFGYLVESSGLPLDACSTLTYHLWRMLQLFVLVTSEQPPVGGPVCVLEYIRSKEHILRNVT